MKPPILFLYGNEGQHGDGGILTFWLILTSHQTVIDVLVGLEQLSLLDH